MQLIELVGLPNKKRQEGNFSQNESRETLCEQNDLVSSLAATVTSRLTDEYPTLYRYDLLVSLLC